MEDNLSNLKIKYVFLIEAKELKTGGIPSEGYQVKDTKWATGILSGKAAKTNL